MPGADMPKINPVSSSASATADCRGGVLVSGSYGGEYNAWHAAKWGIRGVVLNDADARAGATHPNPPKQ